MSDATMRHPRLFRFLHGLSALMRDLGMRRARRRLYPAMRWAALNDYQRGVHHDH